MQKYRLSIQFERRRDPGFSVERIDTLSGRVARLGCFSERAAAIRFAAQVEARTGWHLPCARVLPFDRRVST